METACNSLYCSLYGKQFLKQKINSLLCQDWPQDKLDILIYCDGDKDGTMDLAHEISDKEPRIRVLVDHTRKGKPTAINMMKHEAQGEVLLMTDVRQVLEPDVLKVLISYLADPSVGCVSGNLKLKGSTGAGVYWKYENAIRKAEGQFQGLVGVTGPIFRL